jgi:DNA polymerase III subunit beta
MMQCMILREPLLEALQRIIGVVESRPTTPILSHVLLELVENTLKMECTNSEMTIISQASIQESRQPGKTTVSAYTFLEIVRRLLPKALISLTQAGDQVLVKSGSSHFRLQSLPVTDFPSIALEDSLQTISIPENLLYTTIKATYFAMGQNNPRHYLNGMLWDIREDHFQVVATDGFHLAQRSIPIDVAQQVSMIVPRKTITELVKLLMEDSDRLITINFTDTQLYIQSVSYQLSSRLIAGTFLDYKKLLPKTTHRVAVIDRHLLREALFKLAPLLKQEIYYKGVRLAFTQNFLKLKVSNSKEEIGEASLAVQYTLGQDESFVIGFNLEHLDKILEVLSPGDVQFTFTAEKGVALIEQCNKNPNNHLYLIMPVLL